MEGKTNIIRIKDKLAKANMLDRKMKGTKGEVGIQSTPSV
jgi:hypothetical protein